MKRWIVQTQDGYSDPIEYEFNSEAEATSRAKLACENGNDFAHVLELKRTFKRMPVIVVEEETPK